MIHCSLFDTWGQGSAAGCAEPGSLVKLNGLPQPARAQLNVSAWKEIICILFYNKPAALPGVGCFSLNLCMCVWTYSAVWVKGICRGNFTNTLWAIFVLTLNKHCRQHSKLQWNSKVFVAWECLGSKLGHCILRAVINTRGINTGVYGGQEDPFEDGLPIN